MRYPINPRIGNDALPYWRFEHRATVEYQARIFMIFVDNGVTFNNATTVTPKLYVEEITDGDMKVVEEDELHEELADFAVDNGFATILFPMPKDRANRPLP